jgi:hypothetical protein
LRPDCANDNFNQIKNGVIMEITSFLRNGEQQFYDFNTPWSMVIIVLGFLCAWAVTTVLEHFGWTRHVWHLLFCSEA